MTATIADLDITSLAAGGDGVARYHGQAVFVPRTAVGDVVRTALVSRGRFARGTVRDLVQASPDRVDAPCVHYVHDDCGGCQWQHLAIDAQRAAKAQLLVDAMRRIADVSIPHPEVIGDTRTLGYRRTISLTVRGHGKRRVGGFHAAGDPDTLVPIERCLLAHPDVQRAWDALRGMLGRLPEWRTPTADAPAARRGSVRRGQRSSRQQQSLRVSLRRLGEANSSVAEIAVVVEGGDRWSATAARAIGEGVPGCRGIWWTPAGQGAQLLWDRDRRTAAQHADVGQGVEVMEPSSDLAVAASFVQVNAELAEQMHAFVFGSVLAESPARVIDGYAGAGRLAIALDQAGVQVVAIERDDRACRHAAARLGAASRVLSGTVEARLAEALPADVIVLNPPRAGCDASVCERLVDVVASASPPRALVYVSCDPATLARDVKRLRGWRVVSTTCFDLFPQTAHVETVCLLRPEE